MAKATHKVACIGVMKSNGQLAKHGQEVSIDDFDDFSEKVSGGYLEPIEEEKPKKVDKLAKAEGEGEGEGKKPSPEEKAMIDLKVKYLKAFKAEAPENAEAPEIAKAIKDKVAIVEAES